MTNQPTQENHFLNAICGKNKRVPVWLMRQAGRYLPEYQAVKAKYRLTEMFRTPAIAAEITLQPIDILGVDAAILFADILTLPSGMGFDIDFVKGKGPVVSNPLRSQRDFDQLYDMDGIDYVAETIQLINQKLPEHIPLIGFAGSPFTVLNYLLEGKGGLGPVPALRLAYENPSLFKQIMQKLSDNTIAYAKMQEEAGIKAFQLFDTWAGHLRLNDFRELVLPYVRPVFEAVSVPSIYYVKQCAHVLSAIEDAGSDFLSVCETVVLGKDSILQKTTKGVQGNFYNGLLYCDERVIKKEALSVLDAAKKNYSKYIFNLSHGMMPDMDVQKVKFLVKLVQEYDWAS